MNIMYRKIGEKMWVTKNAYELKGKGHEPSQAENPSAQAMGRASLARTHH